MNMSLQLINVSHLTDIQPNSPNSRFVNCKEPVVKCGCADVTTGKMRRRNADIFYRSPIYRQNYRLQHVNLESKAPSVLVAASISLSSRLYWVRKRKKTAIKTSFAFAV